MRFDSCGLSVARDFARVDGKRGAWFKRREQTEVPARSGSQHRASKKRQRIREEAFSGPEQPRPHCFAGPLGGCRFCFPTHPNNQMPSGKRKQLTLTNTHCLTIDQTIANYLPSNWLFSQGSIPTTLPSCSFPAKEK